MNKKNSHVPLISKKVDIPDEKLVKMTQNVYNRSGADNHCEAKTVHLLSRAVIHSKKPELTVLQPNMQIKPENEAWKHAFLLVMSYLKKCQMELTLSTVIVEVPKNLSLNTKKFSSAESVNNVFNDLMNVKNLMLDKTFEDKLKDFIEEMEMEDFWLKNPLTVTVRQNGASSRVDPSSSLVGNNA